MHVGILGTGRVAPTLAGGLAKAGHQVTLGSRDPQAKGDVAFSVADRAATVQSAAVVVNATPGASSVAIVQEIGSAAFRRQGSARPRERGDAGLRAGIPEREPRSGASEGSSGPLGRQ
ncbi:MAG: NAD(P)-binding domain-containing protein, partial [Solirubrobacterales bacterium]|nr:NAD(P)-binding domain-containing protein [Solirubrobacterales bacterium]